MISEILEKIIIESKQNIYDIIRDWPKYEKVEKNIEKFENHLKKGNSPFEINISAARCSNETACLFFEWKIYYKGARIVYSSIDFEYDSKNGILTITRSIKNDEIGKDEYELNPSQSVKFFNSALDLYKPIIGATLMMYYFGAIKDEKLEDVDEKVIRKIPKTYLKYMLDIKKLLDIKNPIGVKFDKIFYDIIPESYIDRVLKKLKKLI